MASIVGQKEIQVNACVADVRNERQHKRPTIQRRSPIIYARSNKRLTGNLIRLVATGSQTQHLVNVRREFIHGLTMITSGRFWL